MGGIQRGLHGGKGGISRVLPVNVLSVGKVRREMNTGHRVDITRTDQWETVITLAKNGMAFLMNIDTGALSFLPDCLPLGTSSCRGGGGRWRREGERGCP